MIELITLLWVLFNIGLTILIMLKGWGVKPASWTIIVLGYAVQTMVVVILGLLEIWLKKDETKK